MKFIIKEESVGFIIGKNGSFTKYMQEELDVYIKCFRDRHNKALESDESIAVRFNFINVLDDDGNLG